MRAEGQRQRVIQVCPYYPPHLGGMERVAEALANRLAASYDVEVWTSALGAVDATTNPRPTVDVRRLPAKVVANTPVPRGLLRRLIRLPSDTIVHVHVAQAIWPELVVLAAIVRRFSVVAHFHLDVDPTSRAGRLLPFYKRYLLGPALRRADVVIALTPGQREELATRYAIEPSRIIVVPNGVDDGFVALGQPTRSNTEPLRLLFVGRLEAQKNVARLLRALALVREPVELVVVGDGVLRGDLEALTADLGLDHTRFVGAQHGSALRHWYAWADVFVLPSDREGMPLALLEAMAAGLAVVATDVSDLATQVDAAGLIVAPDDSAMANAISRLATKRDLLAGLRDASRKRGSALGWGPMVERLTAVYAGLAA